MSSEETTAFLLAGTRTAKVATVSPAGAPHVVPVWFTMAGQVLLFTTSSRSVKGRHLAADPRVSVCVDDEAPPYAFVTLTGKATLDVRPRDQLEVALRLARRYVAAERVAEVARGYVELDDVVVRVTIERTVARAEVVP